MTALNVTSNGSAAAAFVSAAQAAGVNVSNLEGISQLQIVAANLINANIPILGALNVQADDGAGVQGFAIGRIDGRRRIVSNSTGTIFSFVNDANSFASLAGATVDLIGAPGTAAASHVIIGGNTRTTIGANGGATALTALPLGYLDIDVAGTAAQIPYYRRGA